MGWLILVGVVLKIGTVLSCVGDEAVASMHITRKPLDLGAARKLVGKAVFLEDSRSAKPVGRVTDVVGRIGAPYAVVSLNPKSSVAATQGSLVGRVLYSNVNLKI